MTTDIPGGFTSSRINCDGVNLHIVHNGSIEDGLPFSDPRTPILFLHGFPEFWIAWQSVFVKMAKDFLILAPDQRGYNLSDAPAGVKNYQAKLLVSDIAALVDTLLGTRKFVLAGHDWGGSIAYAIAMRYPKRVSHLVIANGVHPVCFQEAMIDDPNQAKASSYFHILRRDDADRIMGAIGFEKTFSMFEKFSKSPWLDDQLRDAYHTAWGQPGRLKTMLHWYNSSPIHVPIEGEQVDLTQLPLYGASRENFRIEMPHLLLWGENDQALLASSTKDLDQFCSKLTRCGLPEADHWLLHTHGSAIAEEIAGFVS